MKPSTLQQFVCVPKGGLEDNANAFFTVPGGAFQSSLLYGGKNSEQTFFLFSLDKEPPTVKMTSPQVVHLGVTNQTEITVFLMASTPVFAFENGTGKLECRNCEVVEFNDLPSTNRSQFQSDGAMLATGHSL
jgi:hypothetical protein